MTTSFLFRKYNLLIMFNIIDRGDNFIEAGSFTNPLDPVFYLPISKTRN